MEGFINWCHLIKMQVNIAYLLIEVERALHLKFGDLGLNPIITLTGCVTLDKPFNLWKPVCFIYKIAIHLKSCVIVQGKV